MQLSCFICDQLGSTDEPSGRGLWRGAGSPCPNVPPPPWPFCPAGSGHPRIPSLCAPPGCCLEDWGGSGRSVAKGVAEAPGGPLVAACLSPAVRGGLSPEEAPRGGDLTRQGLSGERCARRANSMNRPDSYAPVHRPPPVSYRSHLPTMSLPIDSAPAAAPLPPAAGLAATAAPALGQLDRPMLLHLRHHPRVPRAVAAPMGVAPPELLVWSRVSTERLEACN